MKHLFPLLALVLLLITACQKNETQPIAWLTWEQGVEKAAAQDRKVMVWVYDPECISCKEMDSLTLQHPVISQFLNEHFYCIKFNGKRKEPIVTKGSTFKYMEPLGGGEGYHQLAAALTQSKDMLTYPSIVMLDENMDLIEPAKGKIPPEQLDVILHYVYDNAYKSTSFADYLETFESKVGQWTGKTTVEVERTSSQ